ncbi:MAG: hypothetical protein Kow0069_19570 [Promethearchaeota archaeon]
MRRKVIALVALLAAFALLAIGLTDNQYDAYSLLVGTMSAVPP